jgi:carotenoid cleavage dioxygenase-like enzyme
MCGCLRYQLYRVDTRKTPLQREVVFELDVSNAVYMHSFAHTENYITFFLFPLEFDLLGIVEHTTLLPVRCFPDFLHFKTDFNVPRE